MNTISICATHYELLPAIRANTIPLLERIAEGFEPRVEVPTKAWLTEHFVLPSESGESSAGPYNPDFVPYLWGIWSALDDDAVKVVTMMKAAQVGWTFGLVGFLGKRIDTRPTNIVVMFPKEGGARDFSDEKLAPSVRSTPVLRNKVDVSTSRKHGNRALRKFFPGGFLKLIGSNSINDVKSTPASLVIIEEPDDTNERVKGQGDALRLVKERLKRQQRSKIVLGGTPATQHLSRVEEINKLSTQRVLPVACHDCGEKHVLDFENVSWVERTEGQAHPVYGMADPDSAVYVCPHCGSAWDDYQRKRNVLDTCQAAEASGDQFCGWVPTVAPELTGGVEGFKELSELYVCMPGTSLADVVRDHLEAEHDAERGDQSGRIVFQNSKLGRPYAYTTDAPDLDELKARALDVPEFIVPIGGLIITAGVDVQHDRIAILLDAWGREEESWTFYAGEIYGNTMLRTDPVWSELETILLRPHKSQNGNALGIKAISIDSSDGQTSDAVYSWVRAMNRKHPAIKTMAIKGASHDSGQHEIFSRPKTSIDTRGQHNTKASRYGLKPYIVGTHKSKDLLAGRMKLTGSGPGRWHWYKNIRADFYEQITGEVLAPHRSQPKKLVWQQKAGQPIEFWDCKVYSLHASRAVKVHLMRPGQWDVIERALAQGDLFSAPGAGKEPKPLAAAASPPTQGRGTAPARSMGFRDRLKK